MLAIIPLFLKRLLQDLSSFDSIRIASKITFCSRYTKKPLLPSFRSLFSIIKLRLLLYRKSYLGISRNYNTTSIMQAAKKNLKKNLLLNSTNIELKTIINLIYKYKTEKHYHKLAINLLILLIYFTNFNLIQRYNSRNVSNSNPH